MSNHWKTLIAAVVLASGVSSGAIADGYEPSGKGFVAPKIYSWTGFYVGVNGGYSWGESDTDFTFRDNNTGALLARGSRDIDMNGWIGGGQLGYNKQFSKHLVVGIEVDIQATGQDGGSRQPCPNTIEVGPCNLSTIGPGAGVAPTATLNQDLEWFGTLRGRLGVLLQPTLLAYVTGGWAFGNVESDGVISGFNAQQVAVSSRFSDSENVSGWVIGGGLEKHLTGNWTGKIEYLYMDLGSVSGRGTLLTSSPPLRFDYDSDITDQILRVGLNHRF